MELLDALSQSFDHATEIVSGVQADQLDAPTPCPEWDVRTLVSHSMGVINGIGRRVGGDEVANGPLALVLEADLSGQFRSEADRTLAAWTARGLDGEVDIGAGPMPAHVALGINLVDTTAHSWDIARATGQDGTLPDELATTCLTLAQGFITDDLRRFAGFAPALTLAGDAGPTDQLVAFLGREP